MKDVFTQFEQTGQIHEDLIREFNFEHGRAQDYFEYMYKIVEFAFVAIISVVVAASQLYAPDEYSFFFSILLSYILPICIYTFGTMYIYNVYALSICGKRAEDLHHAIYDSDLYKGINESLLIVINQYIISNRKVTLLSYGVTLGFFLFVPAASHIIAMMLCPEVPFFY